MDRKLFYAEATRALESIEEELGRLEFDELDVQLAGDVLTISFSDGAKFIINAHSAAGQIWMAADKAAWHFDWDGPKAKWIAHKTNDELMATVAAVVGEKLGRPIEL